MLLAAANNAGGITLNQLEGLVVLIWAIAGAVAVLGWIAHSRRSRPVRGLQGMVRDLFAWLRRSTTGARTQPATGGAPATSVGYAGGTPQRAIAAGQEGDPAASGGTPANRPERQSPVAEASTAGPPANPGPRYSPETLELLGQHLDNSRRAVVLEDRLAPLVRSLPRDRWLVERHVLLAGHCIPFVLLGETGVFALWALGGQPRWSDVPVLGRVADGVRNVIPGYTGTMQVGICRPFAPDVQPRWWCRAGEPGVWVMGLKWAIPWLEHFGPEHGLGVKDIELLNEMGGPRWGHGVTDLPPTALVPELDQVSPK